MIRMHESLSLQAMEKAFDFLKEKAKQVYLIKWKTPHARMKVVKVKQIEVVEKSTTLFVYVNKRANEFSIPFQDVKKIDKGATYIAFYTNDMDITFMLKRW